ncbi:MAG: prefoldin subunit alpha [Nanoarchaeota archaeon]|nr:prefoldin subunit alpha [Nanoarchaeota archaeon]
MNKELQQKYLELQMLDQHIKQIQQNVELIENQLSELDQINQALDDLTSVKEGTEIFVPVTGGVFAKAELKDNKNLLVNVGAGTTVNKSIPETRDMISNQINEIADTRDQLLEQLQKAVRKAQKIQEELQEIQEKE